MAQKFEWPVHWNSPARDLRWQAVEILVPMLPRPHNSITAMGRGMRKLRLEKELAEYDLMHRLHRGSPASLDQLVCAGALLITSHKGEFPTRVLPLDEQLLVNPESFYWVAGWVDDRLQITD